MEDGAVQLDVVEGKLNEAFDQDDLRAIDECEVDIIRFHEGKFQRLTVDSEEIEFDEDDEDSEDETIYSIAGWSDV